ncbi:TerB family tellurite resistance protein [Thalassococcus sp. CAU 1522]|uniref:TerB family tellurite resistance protein n=1 Tax=Thalassococcus arenae TaxID=2851652 RepID=A0ABS6N8W0_9RHOB|nr:TerB family tellurite resistance protein [Thalassococcus arenae]MBV2360432.1 TerB family tellurite resistance protein [Thalassococcus arenae]
MLERFTALLKRKAAKPEPLPKPDAELALGTLLVRVAMADKSYLFEEIAQIDRILAAAYGLKPLEAAKMRATCERLAFAVDNEDELIALIRDQVDYEHRREKVEAMWRVVVADGITDEREDALMTMIEHQMGVARSDSEAARAAAAVIP